LQEKIFDFILSHFRHYYYKINLSNLFHTITKTGTKIIPSEIIHESHYKKDKIGTTCKGKLSRSHNLELGMADMG